MKIAEYYKNLIYMRKHYWMLLLGLGLLSSCEKVKDLSDEASIERFEITSYTPSTAELGDLYRDDKFITIPVVPEDNLFPLTCQTVLETSSSTHKILGNYEKGQDIVFNGGESTINFFLIAESGFVHPYTIRLEPIDTGADITYFKFTGSDKMTVAINPWNKTVNISVLDPGFPITIEPNIHLSENATYDGYTEGESLTFNGYDDIKKITVVSEDGQTRRTWNIQFTGLIQIPNSDFELWGKFGNEINLNVETIDPTPGYGKGWATANNTFVKGTLPVEHNGGYAAKMTTNEQNTLIFGKLIAAGSMYTGCFKFDVGALNDPRSMTHFGIPHTLRIKSIEFDARYEPGPQLKQAVKSGSKYSIEDREGVDVGQAFVELIRWTGTGEFEYHGRPADGVELLGRGEILFDGKDSKYRNWAHYNLPVEYTDYEKIPTHIVIVFSSSKSGDIFLGAPGSTMEVDNVKLIY